MTQHSRWRELTRDRRQDCLPRLPSTDRDASRCPGYFWRKGRESGVEADVEVCSGYHCESSLYSFGTVCGSRRMGIADICRPNRSSWSRVPLRRLKSNRVQSLDTKWPCTRSAVRTTMMEVERADGSSCTLWPKPRACRSRLTMPRDRSRTLLV